MYVRVCQTNAGVSTLDAKNKTMRYAFESGVFFPLNYSRWQLVHFFEILYMQRQKSMTIWFKHKFWTVCSQHIHAHALTYTNTTIKWNGNEYNIWNLFNLLQTDKIIQKFNERNKKKNYNAIVDQFDDGKNGRIIQTICLLCLLFSWKINCNLNK